MAVPVSTSNSGKKIRVMVVDDSMVARSMIIRGLSTHPRIEVVGFAINTLDAKNKIPLYKPDVVTMDVEMPGQSGIDFLKQYLPTNPIPVILVSTLNLKVFDALAVGAVDFVRKPDSQQSTEAFLVALAQKVIMASTAACPASSVSALTAASFSIPSIIFCTGSCQPITPVDATSTASSGISKTWAAFAAVCLQQSYPCLPVQALAIPALTMTAWA